MFIRKHFVYDSREHRKPIVSYYSVNERRLFMFTFGIYRLHYNAIPIVSPGCNFERTLR